MLNINLIYNIINNIIIYYIIYYCLSEMIKNDKDINIFLLEYYNTYDDIHLLDEADENDKEGNDENDKEEDDKNPSIYKKFAYYDANNIKYTNLIKLFGVLENGESISINVTNFTPFFYVKIPDNWIKNDVDLFIRYIKNYDKYDKKYKFKFSNYDNIITDYELLKAKPFSHFTGDDQFNYVKIYFKNIAVYNKYCKLFKTDIIYNGMVMHFKLHESNIDHIIRFIHKTDINPSGWITIESNKYKIIKRLDRTTTTKHEITIKHTDIKVLDKIDIPPLNIMSFDIECNSSHGDFPLSKKQYKKLAQDVMSIYSIIGSIEYDVKIKYMEQIIKYAFDDYYMFYNIKHIDTIDNIKPPNTEMSLIAEQILLEYENINNKSVIVPHISNTLNKTLPHPVNEEAYNLLSNQIYQSIKYLIDINYVDFFKDKKNFIINMIKIAFNDNYINFNISRIYTKNNEKPSNTMIHILIPSIIKILDDMQHYELSKKLVKNNDADDINYTDILNNFFQKYFPAVEGDVIIQIGSTIQMSKDKNCYMKHILCLDQTDEFTNEDIIREENNDTILSDNDIVKFINEKKYETVKDCYNYDKCIDIISKMGVAVADMKEEDIKELKKLIYFYNYKEQTKDDKAQVIVKSYKNESSLLSQWCQLVKECDPDIIIGYNICGFDFKFMYERAEELNCVEDFCKIGRIIRKNESLQTKVLSSSAYGENTLVYMNMTGRIIVDLYKHIQREFKYDSYKLSYVGNALLNKGKLDLDAKDIFRLQKGSSKDRANIAKYCLIDCILCNRIFLKLEVINNSIAMSNVCKVPIQPLFFRGQQFKTFSLVAYNCNKNGYIIPVLINDDNLDDDTKFEGAIVLKPNTGIYFDPVVVADFNSLYPSCIISENLSHDTYVEVGGIYDNLSNYDYTDIEYDIYKYEFKDNTKKKIKVKIGVKLCRYIKNRIGILPLILQNLLKARKNAKKMMDNEKDKEKAKIWNGIQLAYKVTGNSVYGGTGAKTSPIYKVDIASCTTSVGRRMIMFSKNYIETVYKKQGQKTQTVISFRLNIPTEYILLKIARVYMAIQILYFLYTKYMIK